MEPIPTTLSDGSSQAEAMAWSVPWTTPILPIPTLRSILAISSGYTTMVTSCILPATGPSGSQRAEHGSLRLSSVNRIPDGCLQDLKMSGVAMMSKPPTILPGPRSPTTWREAIVTTWRYWNSHPPTPIYCMPPVTGTNSSGPITAWPQAPRGLI